MNDVRRLLEHAARLFNDKRYFECHDLLEEAWRDARGDERAFLHALIQVSVGMYHVAAGNHQGAVNLLTRGVEGLTPFAPVAETLEVEGLVEKASRCLDKSARALSGEAMEWVAGDVPRMVLRDPS